MRRILCLLRGHEWFMRHGTILGHDGYVVYDERGPVVRVCCKCGLVDGLLWVGP